MDLILTFDGSNQVVRIFGVETFLYFKISLKVKNFLDYIKVR